MNDRFGINRSLDVEFFPDAVTAIKHGYAYSTWENPPKPMNIDKVVVVRNGTQAGAGTIDLILIDEHGNKYVTMVTAALMKMVADAA